MNAHSTLPASLEAQIAALLAAAGLSSTGLVIQPVAGGGNNRLYRLDTAGGVYLAKQYFRHAEDKRDRLTAEYAFLSLAAEAAPGDSPRPLAKDAQTGLALHEFIAGRPLRAEEIGTAEVDAAMRFLCALNAPRARARAVLPEAAEACFSIDTHLALVDARVTALAPHLAADGPAGAAAIGKRLASAWQGIAAAIRRGAADAGIDTGAVLPAAARCISPSDFGFHNALRDTDGRLRFVDFEYAGWDDPAKLAGDFFQQLAVPAPATEFCRFAAAVAAVTDDATPTLARIHLLRPLFAVKWCCIVLNVFLPVHLARRRFADPGIDAETMKRAQLDKAARQLAVIEYLIANKDAAWLT